MAQDEKKKEFVNLITPKGVVTWANLNALDMKYKKEAGEWHVKVAFDPSEKGVSAFLQDLEERADAAFEAALNDPKLAKVKKSIVRQSPVSDETDDNGDETGRKIVRFHKLGKTKDKKNPSVLVDAKPPRFFDAKGKPLVGKDVPRVGSGSTLKVAFGPSAYYNAATKGAGVTCYLNDVQVIDLVEFGGGGGRNPFSDEGDGFTAPETEGFRDETETDSEDTSVNGADF